jgi:oligoendopeptidase F
VAQEYYQLKADLLGVKQLAYHERNLPYGQLDKQYAYEQAVELVSRVFAGLDAEFVQIFRLYVNQGQIDVYPGTGKASGAFCAHGLLVHPTYILLNYTDRLMDVLTLAHECGHGIHNELIKQQQPGLYFGTSLAIAEVASTFMEDFVLQQIMKEADDELRLAIMMMRLNDEVATIFRQVAFYRFEQELHSRFRTKGYLPKEEIGTLFRQHMVAYMGPAVEQSPGSENWWIYVGHFRRFFYVYSYASGLLISKALQKQVHQDGQAIGLLKQVLRAGASASPREIFARVGIDIGREQFWIDGVAEVAELLAETKELAKKLGKVVG